MFGSDMMGKLQEMKQQMDEIKTRLDTITVEGESGGGAVRVTVTGNRKIKNVEISDALRSADKEELEDMLIMALNDGLEKAEKVNEAEMQGAASGMMPGLGSMFGK